MIGPLRAASRPAPAGAEPEEIIHGFCSHRWRVHDLVMWDNRCTLPRDRPWDETRHRRVMNRTTVAGEGPTVP